MRGGEGRWVPVASRSNLAAGDVLAVEIGAREIAIYDCDGVLYATDNICTHAQAQLSEGWLDGETIECPLHGARFDVRGGKVLAPPAIEDLKTYPVRVVAGTIEVEIP
jgi:naphthalene 1,2-dioxygenase ferredoxin component